MSVTKYALAEPGALSISRTSTATSCAPIIGVGGVFSYLVEEQRREIGIRLALGGSRAQIAAALASACRGAVIGGLTVGLALSVAAGIVLRSFLFGLHPLDPISYAAVA